MILKAVVAHAHTHTSAKHIWNIKILKFVIKLRGLIFLDNGLNYFVSSVENTLSLSNRHVTIYYGYIAIPEC